MMKSKKTKTVKAISFIIIIFRETMFIVSFDDVARIQTANIYSIALFQTYISHYELNLLFSTNHFEFTILGNVFRTTFDLNYIALISEILASLLKTFRPTGAIRSYPTERSIAFAIEQEEPIRGYLCNLYGFFARFSCTLDDFLVGKNSSRKQFSIFNSQFST